MLVSSFNPKRSLESAAVDHPVLVKPRFVVKPQGDVNSSNPSFSLTLK